MILNRVRHSVSGGMHTKNLSDGAYSRQQVSHAQCAHLPPRNYQTANWTHLFPLNIVGWSHMERRDTLSTPLWPALHTPGSLYLSILPWAVHTHCTWLIQMTHPSTTPIFVLSPLANLDRETQKGTGIIRPSSTSTASCHHRMFYISALNKAQDDYLLLLLLLVLKDLSTNTTF